MLNDGVADAALANVVVKAIGEMIDIGLAASLGWQGECLLRPTKKLLDAPDIAVVEADGGGTLDHGPNAGVKRRAVRASAWTIR